MFATAIISSESRPINQGEQVHEPNKSHWWFQSAVYKDIRIIYIDSLVITRGAAGGPVPSARQSVRLGPRRETFLFYDKHNMKYAALFALLAVACARDSDPTAVDNLRNKFYALEKQLWLNVTNPEWSLGGLGGDVELTKAFVAFDEQIQAVPPPPRVPFETWLWAKATEKLRVIEGYYKNFIIFVRRQAQPGIVPAPVREWLDLAQQMMDEKSPVVQATKKITDMLELGDMFRGVLQVLQYILSRCSFPFYYSERI